MNVCDTPDIGHLEPAHVARRPGIQPARLVMSAAGMLLAACAGCLERKETIRISPEGAVHVEIEYSGEPQQFETADALPSQASGWAVQRSRHREDNGKETVTIVAARQFAPREDLPQNYAAAGDPDADLYVQFPTSVQVERRPDGVYMHFRRIYQPRPWAYVEFWQDQFVDDDIKKRAEKPLEELTHEDRVRIVKAFAGFEFYKQIELFRAALKQVDSTIRQDVWLRARQAALEAGEQTDWDSLVERIAALPEDQRDKAFEAESHKLIDRTHQAFLSELAGAGGLDDRWIERVEASFARARKQHQVTSDAGSHAFSIQVHMPGEIVAHNADKIDDDGAAVWEFGGDAFRDRSYDLMITSRIGQGNSNR